MLTALVLATLGAGPDGVSVRMVTADGARYVVVTADTRKAQVRLRRDCGGTPCRSLARAAEGVLVATNAGIFEPNFTPTGLLVVDGTELRPLNRGQGQGNFYLAPNGVFSIGVDGVPRVRATAELGAHEALRQATQSGPLLVQRGKVNPAFTPGSKNRYQRSGVGVHGATVHLVLSLDEVSFHQLAAVFRDELQDDDALYLDGAISALTGPGVPANGQPTQQYAAFVVVSAGLDAGQP